LAKANSNWLKPTAIGGNWLLPTKFILTLARIKYGAIQHVQYFSHIKSHLLKIELRTKEDLSYSVLPHPKID
jgi:hypothetical protein